MLPSGPPTPVGGSQSVSNSILRSNSGMLQGGSLSSQTGFSTLVSPRTQFNNMNVLGNVPNMSSLLNQSFVNSGPNSGISGSGGVQRGGLDVGAESDPLSSVGNGMGLNGPSSSFMPSNVMNPGQVQGPQVLNSSGNQQTMDQQQSQQLESQSFQHNQQQMQQFPGAQNGQLQHQFQTMRGGLGGVKLEPQLMGDQHGGQSQQLQQLRNLGQVKMEAQQMQSIRNMPQVKMEPQHSDQSLFLHQQQQHHQQQQQQQQQQLLHMSRQSPQAAAAAQLNLLQQQRLLQLQQQQQLLKVMPQRSQMPHQFQQPNLPMRAPVKPVYEPGMCARRLTHYMYQQQHRPEDNNIEFWRKFVAEYFALNAKKKWCVSMYGSSRQTSGVFPQDAWHCEICNRKPGRGFEATVEVLPRLLKIKYESGTLDELLYVDMPREYHNSSGQIVLDYAKAIQESVFEQLRVVRDGQLRIVFSPDLKICSWEFCARKHEELIPRRLLIPQVSQLGAAASKYQAAAQNASSNTSVTDLQNNCNLFVASARQLAKALEVPLVNDLGYTKRYVRCLQISEVVNSMKDLIDYSRETGTGPMESLAKFPRRTPSGFHSQQTDEQQQTLPQNSNVDHSAGQATPMQMAASNGVADVNNPLNAASASVSGSAAVALLHQNSINSRQPSPMNNTSSSPYGGNSVQIPSPGSSNTIPQAQSNSLPFQAPTPTSNNTIQSPLGGMAASNQVNSANSPANVSMQKQPEHSGDAEHGETQSSVEKILRDMINPNQFKRTDGSLGNDGKNTNGVLPTGNLAINGGNGLLGNGTMNNSGLGGMGFNTMGGGGLGHSGMIRAAMGNNPMMSGRMSMQSMIRQQSMNHQQQDMGNQLLNGLGAVNGFNNLQFDWKPSP